jgi:hypothetical protein
MATDLGSPVMPRIGDDMWAQHGPALQAAENDRVEALAALVEVVGPEWPG